MKATDSTPRRTAVSAISSGEADWDSLELVQRQNEAAYARCVGLVVEARPDHLDYAVFIEHRMNRVDFTRFPRYLECYGILAEINGF